MKRYISSLDGLRGFGILFVVLYHLIILQGQNATIVGFSWVFIQMFFIQSGYLITKILVNSKDQPLKIYLKKFFWNRILRIFPVYFLYLFLLMGIYLLIQSPVDFWQRAPFLFTYTYNFTRLIESIDFHPLYVHLWSLSVEEQFYLVWPFFIYFLSGRQLKFFVISMFILCPVVRYFLAEYLLQHSTLGEERVGEAVYGFTLSHFDAFAAGSAIVIFSLEDKKQFAWKTLTLVGGIAVAVLAVNHFTSPSIYEDVSWTNLGLQLANLGNLQHVWSYTLVNVLFALIILVIIQSTYRGIFHWKPFVAMGKVVYGTYIFHFLILLILSRTLGHLPVWTLYLIAMPAAYIAGHLSYTFFEKKFLRFKY